MSKMLVYDMVDTNCQKYLNTSEITLGLHTYKPGNLRSSLAWPDPSTQCAYRLEIVSAYNL